MYTGTPTQVNEKPLLLELEADEEFNDQHPLFEIFSCVTFWNNKGRECHKMNGTKGESYEDFILTCIAADCRVFVNAKPSKYMITPQPGQFETGKGGNHVWVHRAKDNERIMFIHF